HEQGGIERAGISIEQIQDADHRLSAEVLAHDRREQEIARVQDENGPAFRLEPFAKRPHAGEPSQPSSFEPLDLVDVVDLEDREARPGRGRGRPRARRTRWSARAGNRTDEHETEEPLRTPGSGRRAHRRGRPSALAARIQTRTYSGRGGGSPRSAATRARREVSSWGSEEARSATERMPAASSRSAAGTPIPLWTARDASIPARSRTSRATPVRAATGATPSRRRARSSRSGVGIPAARSRRTADESSDGRSESSGRTD